MNISGMVVIILLLVSVVSISDSFGDSSKRKSRLWGTHEMKLYGEPQIDFKVNPLIETPYVVNADVQIGNYKTNLFGGGFIKPTYGYYDKQCKSLTGFEYLFSENGDFVRVDYKGKVCYIGMNVKSVNMIFTGSSAKGIFENATIDGTLSGNSDRYETLYDLRMNSVLVYED